MPAGKATQTEICQAAVCTPHDSTNNAVFGDRWANRLWVGVAGTVTIVGVDAAATTLQFPAVIAGRWHVMPPFQRVNDTNTAATGIVVGVTY